ncbi:MAG: MBL fold metallo-hydrolase [Erysipelotrichaceae bacterium]|nr:MBL fold metallo-hydrolase [Erysipelotrichaceae bacterium]
MKVKRLILGAMAVNCYVVYDESSRHCLIIDPGDIGKKVHNFIVENELQPLAILLTHSHFDHIGAVDYLVDRYHVPVYIHSEGIVAANDPNMNLSCHYTPMALRSALFASDDLDSIGEFRFEYLHLPGHTPDSCMIYFKDQNAIFSGDVLFQGAIGRFDFPNSSRFDTRNTIEKIKKMEFDAVVYPGHGDPTTLQEEQKSNYYLT